MGIWEISYVMLWLMVLGLGLLVVALLRHVGGLEVRIEELSRQRVSRVDRSGLPPGSPAPALTLLDGDGNEVVFTPGHGRRTVVVLSQPRCTRCDRLLPELGRLAAEPDAPEVVVITRGTPGSSNAPPGVRVLYQRGAEAMARFRAFATPWVFVIGRNSLVQAQGTASDRSALRRLLTESADALHAASARPSQSKVKEAQRQKAGVS